MVDRDIFCAYALHNDIDFMISKISCAFCSRGITFLCLSFEFNLLHLLKPLFYFLNLYSFMLFSNHCFLSIRDSCLDQRGALLHFRIQVLCLVFCTSIVPKQLGNPSGSTYTIFRPTCSIFLYSIFLRFCTFFLLILLFARFLYFVHFIRLPFNN